MQSPGICMLLSSFLLVILILLGKGSFHEFLISINCPKIIMALLIITLWSSDSCIYNIYLYPTYILYFIVFLHVTHKLKQLISFRMHSHAEYMHIILYSVTVHDCIHACTSAFNFKIAVYLQYL